MFHAALNLQFQMTPATITAKGKQDLTDYIHGALADKNYLPAVIARQTKLFEKGEQLALKGKTRLARAVFEKLISMGSLNSSVSRLKNLTEINAHFVVINIVKDILARLAEKKAIRATQHRMNLKESEELLRDGIEDIIPGKPFKFDRGRRQIRDAGNFSCKRK